MPYHNWRVVQAQSVKINNILGPGEVVQEKKDNLHVESEEQKEIQAVNKVAEKEIQSNLEKQSQKPFQQKLKSFFDSV